MKKPLVAAFVAMPALYPAIMLATGQPVEWTVVLTLAAFVAGGAAIAPLLPRTPEEDAQAVEQAKGVIRIAATHHVETESSPVPLRPSTGHRPARRGRLLPATLVPDGRALYESSFLAAVFALTGTAFVALGLWFGTRGVQAIRADQRLWALGHPATAAEVQGRVKTRSAVFHEVMLKARWTDANGGEHQGTAQIDTLGPRPTVKGGNVRYDPASPERFVAATALEWAPWRWAHALSSFALGLVMSQLFLFAWRKAREVLDVRACAQGGVEVELEVVEARDVKVSGAAMGRHYTLRGLSPWGLPLTAALTPDTVAGGPLFLDREGRRCLGLVHPTATGRRAVVVRETLLPYAFDPAVREQVLARVSAAREPPPGRA